MNNCRQSIATLWNQFRLASIYDKLSMISFGALCLFFVDCSFSGGGHYLQIGPLTPRMFFILIATLAAVPALLKNAGKLIRNPICIFVIAFVVYLAICAVRGYRAGNRMNVLISDLKGFAWLFLVPVLMVTIKDRRRFRLVVNSIILGSALQAVFILIVNFVCSVVPDGIQIFYNPMIDTQIGTVSSISDTMFRIFTKSSPYMVLTCGLVIYRQAELKKLNVWYILIVALCMNALLLSFTRSVYGCILVVMACAVVVIAILHRTQLLKCVKFVALCAALTLVLVFIGELTLGGNYLNFAISRTLGTEVRKSAAVSLHNVLEDAFSPESGDNDSANLETNEDENLHDQEKYIEITQKSDAYRVQTQTELKQIIAKNPIFGSGLGASAPCREDGLDEYFYLDVLARMGIVGLILYVLPFGYILFICFKKRAIFASFVDGGSAICGMMGFWAITWFNPWMNAVLGIACYALCASVPQNIEFIEE